MKYRPKRSSSLFLMELMIALFFFMIVAVCCTRMFVKAWMTSQKASDLNRAENCARNVAEVIGSSQDSETDLMKIFPEMTKEGKKYFLYYDKEWKTCDRKEAVYRMEVLMDSYDGFVFGDIAIKDKEGKELYQLDMKKHIPYRSGKEE